MTTTERHYATFFSPGTFVSEVSTRPIESWDPRLAIAIAETISERYGAKPYAFRFETRLEAEPIPDGRGGKMNVDPKTLRTSGLHFLGGKLETFDDVVARNDPKENILRMNMSDEDRCIVCINTNSYRSTIPFEPDSVIVDATGAITERGDDPKHVAYRAARKAAREAEWAASDSGGEGK